MENKTEKGDMRYGTCVRYHCSVLGSLFKMCLGESHSMVFAGSVQRACKIRVGHAAPQLEEGNSSSEGKGSTTSYGTPGHSLRRWVFCCCWGMKVTNNFKCLGASWPDLLVYLGFSVLLPVL